MPSWLVTLAGSLLLTGVVAASLTTSWWYLAEFGAP
jgi:ABC-type xylose transport system permease subunit